MKNKLKFIRFHYIKNNDYRTFYANGIFGGLTPQKEIHMNFFNERAVIP